MSRAANPTATLAANSRPEGYGSTPGTGPSGLPHSHLAGENAFSRYHAEDPRCGLVDQYTLEHLHPATDPLSKIVREAAEYAASQGLPDISASPVQAKLLGQLAYTARAKHILELGTLGGVTAIWLASLNPQAKVTTVEFKAHHAKVARQNIANAGLSERIEVINGAGLDVLPKLKAEIDAGKRERLGFTFVDADKENNWAYFDMAIGMSAPGAPITVDNIVWGGMLVDPACQGDGDIIGSKQVVENAGKDDRVMGVVVQMVGEKTWDGMLFAVVK